MSDNAKINKSKPPLRWIANLAGEIASKALWQAALLDERRSWGLKYKIYGKIYAITFPMYNRYGTFYKWEFDMSGPEWNDYDENGIPYWEKTGTIDPDYQPIWDYEDEETGDAFRVVRIRK